MKRALNVIIAMVSVFFPKFIFNFYSNFVDSRVRVRVLQSPTATSKVVLWLHWSSQMPHQCNSHNMYMVSEFCLPMTKVEVKFHQESSPHEAPRQQFVFYMYSPGGVKVHRLKIT